MTVAIINIWGIILKGGPMMWPIFFLSVLAVTIAIEKTLFLNSYERQVQALRILFLKAVRENRMKDALDVCENNASGIGRMYKVGLMHLGSSVDVIMTSMQEAAGFEIYYLKERLGLLAFIVNAAPLLGLLATTTALSVVFHAAQMRANALNPLSLGDMSSGIWQALISTSAGLLIGIVSYCMHCFLASRINAVIRVLEQIISETGAILQAVGQHQGDITHDA